MYYQQANPYTNIGSFFKGRSILSQLIIINIAVWLGINIIRLLLFLFQIHNIDIVSYLGVPSNIHKLLTTPWTLITYMFTQEGFFHIFFNMLLLYVGGKIFTDYLSEKKLLTTYIFGGLFGGLFYVASYNIFPAFQNVVSSSIAIGASASVLAILVAIAVYVPNYSITFLLIGRIKLIHVALIFIVIDLLSIEKDNPGGHLAHLGGALWGYLYIMQLKRGGKISRIEDSKIFRFKFSNLFKRKPKIKISYTDRGRPLTDDEYNEIKARNQKKMDMILDKISKSGYDSLSKEEKEFLFKSGNK